MDISGVFKNKHISRIKMCQAYIFNNASDLLHSSTHFSVTTEDNCSTVWKSS